MSLARLTTLGIYLLAFSLCIFPLSLRLASPSLWRSLVVSTLTRNDLNDWTHPRAIAAWHELFFIPSRNYRDILDVKKKFLYFPYSDFTSIEWSLLFFEN